MTVPPVTPQIASPPNPVASLGSGENVRTGGTTFLVPALTTVTPVAVYRMFTDRVAPDPLPPVMMAVTPDVVAPVPAARIWMVEMRPSSSTKGTAYALVKPWAVENTTVGVVVALDT